MKLYTINDLKDKLNTLPCSSEKGYISYSKEEIINLVKQDFNGRKLYLEKKCWQNDAPMIWGIHNRTIPYPEEVESFAKSKKTHGVEKI